MKIHYLSLFFALMSGVALADAATNKAWEGTYTYTESGMNATETRSILSRYCLDVLNYNGTLYGEKYNIENSDTSSIVERYETKVKGDTITFTYQSCFDLQTKGECDNSEHKRGDKMLVLKKFQKGTDTFFKPKWFGLSAFNYDESSKDLHFIKEDVSCEDGGVADGDAEMEKEFAGEAKK